MIKIGYSRVLILSPHTDDAELAAGGTIAKFAHEGKDIHYVAFSSCDTLLPTGNPQGILEVECRASVQNLGLSPQNTIVLDFNVRTFSRQRQEILDEMIKLKEAINPDLVLIPSSHDIHQDHQVIHIEALRAFKMSSSIWGYEHPWNNMGFNTDVFVQLKEAHIEKKIASLSNYKSQDRRFYFDDEYIRGQAYSRGVQVGYKYAEAFELLRLLIK